MRRDEIELFGGGLVDMILAMKELDLLVGIEDSEDWYRATAWTGSQETRLYKE